MPEQQARETAARPRERQHHTERKQRNAAPVADPLPTDGRQFQPTVHDIAPDPLLRALCKVHPDRIGKPAARQLRAAFKAGLHRRREKRGGDL